MYETRICLINGCWFDTKAHINRVQSRLAEGYHKHFPFVEVKQSNGLTVLINVSQVNYLVRLK